MLPFALATNVRNLIIFIIVVRGGVFEVCVGSGGPLTAQGWPTYTLGGLELRPGSGVGLKRPTRPSTPTNQCVEIAHSGRTDPSHGTAER